MAACADDIAVPRSRLDRLPRPDGVSLALESWPGDGLPVLFAHGFGQTRGAWQSSAQRLAERGYKPLTLDARGHGDSGRNASCLDYRMEQFIDDLQVVAATQAQPAVLVGASMGGLLGIAAQALSAPFRALVLVDITPRWDARGVERILGFMGAHPDGFDSLEQAADAIAAYLPHRPRKAPESLTSVLRRDRHGRWQWHWDPRLLDSIGRGGDAYQQSLIDAARTISVPTLLISGGRSDLIGDQQVAEFMHWVPHAQHLRIDDATHMVAGDRNDVFTDAILAFLSSVAAPATGVSGVMP